MLDDLTRAVILAASAPSCDAPKYWRQAKQLCAIADWPDTCARLLPEIYVNIPHESDPELLGLAKGVYRQTWSKNVGLLSAAARFAIELNQAGINYRITKGGALALIHGKHGIRRMGDIDWVFHSRDGRRIIEVLIQIGFLPRYEFPDNRESEIWDDASGNTFDLHFLNKRSYLKISFDGLREIYAFNTKFKVPSLEELVTIAAIHAAQGNAKSDLAQGLVDVALVSPQIDSTKLARAIARSGQSRKLHNFFQTLSELQNGERILGTEPYPRNSVRSALLSFLPDIKKRRRLFTPIEFARFKAAPKSFRNLRYLTWLTFGSLRPIEHWNFRFFGGFLKTTHVQGSLTARIDFLENSISTSNLAIEVGQFTDNEFRFAFRKRKHRKVDLHLIAHLESATPRMIFVNGIGHGHFTPRFSQSLSLSLDPQLECVEVSLRDFSDRKRPWRGHLEIRINQVNS